MASRPITSWQIDGETMETVRGFIWGAAPKSMQMVTAAMKLKDDCSLGQPRQNVEKQRYYLSYKGLSSKFFFFPISHVRM